MARIGAVPVGTPVPTLIQAGASANVKPVDGALLGFWVATAQSIAVYDSATTAGDASATLILATQAIASGWNSLPVTFRRGLAFAVSSTATVVPVLAE